MRLAVDIGNSRLAAGLFEAGRLVQRVSVPVIDVSDSTRFFGRREGVTAAVACSVAPVLDAAASVAVERETGVRLLFVKRDLAVPLRVDFENPEEVGADRLAAALAAHRRFGGAIVADLGTATTVDAVSPEGEYLGGAIAPGAAMSARALAEGTELLPEVRPAPPDSPLDRSTAAAIRSGLAYGLAGFVDRMVDAIREAVGAEWPAIATGGGAELMLPFSKRIAEADPDLTLKGALAVLDAHGAGRAGQRETA